MKKILCLFSAFSVVLLSSCSNDDNNSDGGSSSTALPTKITLTTVEDGDKGTLDYTFTYDGNKLKQISLSDASRYAYTYTDNLITKVELYKSGILFSTDVYAYDNSGKLTSRITTRAFSSYSKDKLTFLYNANGTVTVSASQIVDGEEGEYYESTIYTFANGNISSTEVIGDDGYTEKITSTYDNKKTPFVNVTGLKQLLDLALDTDLSFDFYSVNNTLTSKTVYTGEEVETVNTTFTNKYNSDNFLTETFSGDNTDSFKVQITY
ncbi:hypothetical protein [Flavobacterium flavigenum]|uniref:hypothetical protein n=1 Tax=Flavobacterium flavigenum TaxID=3003258 RepID=UPI0022AC0349|nr:hypothetical protein [Flavobacterium flavigenum]